MDKQWGTGKFNFKLHSLTLQGDLRYTTADNRLDWRIAAHAHLSARLGPIVVVMTGIGIGFGDWDTSQDEVVSVIRWNSTAVRHGPLLTITRSSSCRHMASVSKSKPDPLVVVVTSLAWRTDQKYAGVLSLSIMSGTGQNTAGFAVTHGHP